MSTDRLEPHESHLQSLVTRAVVRACAMGLLADRPHCAVGGPEDAAEALREILHAAHTAGVAVGISVPVDVKDAARWEELAADLLAALGESPMPDLEWLGLERVLGPKLLAALVNVSPSSYRRYATGTRATPDAVAARLHLIALIVADLAGSYNNLGVRRWFARPRAQLGGNAPAALLHGAWDPEADGPQRVRRLAAALSGPSATH